MAIFRLFLELNWWWLWLWSVSYKNWVHTIRWPSGYCVQPDWYDICIRQILNWKHWPVSNQAKHFHCISSIILIVIYFGVSGVPKSIQKDKKGRNKHHHAPASTTFHVPRNLDIQLEQSKVTPNDVISLRYYTEYQWLVDFSLYASIIYCISEVYHFYFPLKEEVNLSMMWCLLVIFFALYPYTKQNFRTFWCIVDDIFSLTINNPFAANYWFHSQCNTSRAKSLSVSDQHAS